MSQLRTRKRFGQHFLHDQQIIDRIIGAIAPQPGQGIVEIGPGAGALTLPLLQLVRELHVVELDRDLAADLVRRCQKIGALHMHCQDVLDFDVRSLATGGKTIRVIGNLPYNISTPLIFHLLDAAEQISNMVFMLQEEVVDRICAVPGSRIYGRLSVMVQARCQVDKLFTVSPTAFIPPPKVSSAIVRLTPRPQYGIRNYDTFSDIVRLAFNQRRKTLRNALKGAVDEQQLASLGIDPGVRAEQLSVEEFVSISNSVSSI